MTKPQLETVRVSLDDVEQGAGWSVDNLSGLVTFAAPPAAGVVVKAGLAFDAPVRFERDSLEIDLAYFTEDAGAGSAPDVGLVEVRE